jgi:tetratricopeptide (TPR) repeat protein
MGRPDEVEAIAADVERIQPHRPEACALRAAVAVTQQRYADAGADFDCVVRLAGDDYPDINYAAIADVFAKAGDTRKENHYRRLAGLAPVAAAGINPAAPATSAAPAGAPTGTGSADIGSLLGGMQDDIRANNDAGIALAEQGKFDDARAAFLKALMLDPGNPLTLTNLCAVDTQRNDVDTAIDECERGRGRGGEESADLHYNLALAYARKRRFDKAKWHLGRAKALGRDTVTLEQFIARQEAAQPTP